MLLAHLKKGETYRDLAIGLKVGTTTAYRYLREGLDVLAALAPTLEQAIQTAVKMAYVILDGTLLRIDRAAMASKSDRITRRTRQRRPQALAYPAQDPLQARPCNPPGQRRSNPDWEGADL